MPDVIFATHLYRVLDMIQHICSQRHPAGCQEWHQVDTDYAPAVGHRSEFGVVFGAGVPGNRVAAAVGDRDRT